MLLTVAAPVAAPVAVPVAAVSLAVSSVVALAVEEGAVGVAVGVAKEWGAFRKVDRVYHPLIWGSACRHPIIIRWDGHATAESRREALLSKSITL
tara:strand:+ start:1104 stop:1388 length:285 start_codon:yes stop_codon:yes gene_type:complete